MTAIRWTRRALDAILLVALAAVALTAVVAIAAPLTGGRAMVIGGGSMEPTIPKGALVLAVPADRYGVGDVVAVAQPGNTPYTHRISRLAELDGEPYVETKGDANAQPDPAIVPAASIAGRIDLALPLLGYLGLLLGSAAGLVGFVAVGGSLLIMSGALEEWEDRFCPVCADEAERAAAGLAGSTTTEPTREPPTIEPPAPAPAVAALAATTAVARAGAREPVLTRVREAGRARAIDTPVLLERDRRNPRRHGRATVPATPPAAIPERALERATELAA
jgi:signal peptidase